MTLIKKMQTTITIFLSVAVVVLVIALTAITKWYVSLCKQYEESGACIDELIADNKLLLEDKRELIRQNDELLFDNQQLTAAVREMREMIKKLTDPMQESPQITIALLPENVHTNTYRCEPYMVIDEENSTNTETIYKSAFSKNSDQYRLQQDKDCMTEKATGLRVYVDNENRERYFCAAMATAYGTEIGHAYKVTLKCGTVFNVIVSDFKHPIDNPRSDDYGDADTNYDGEKCINIIEFVVDMQAVPEKVRKAGTMSALEQFGGLYGDGGDIVSIEDLGRVWEP